MNAAIPTENAWFTRERLLVVILAIATFLGIYVCYLIIKPFIAPIVFAIALCVATQRPYNWLRARLPSDTWAAAAGVVLVSLLIIGPLVLLGFYVANQLTENLDQFTSGDAFVKLRDNLISRLPFQEQIQRILADLNIAEQFRNVGGAVASNATAALRQSINVITQLVIMLFVLFFLYRDRQSAKAAAKQLLPLADDEANQLFGRVRDTILATVNGSITVAAVQSALATIMYIFLGVPGAVLWGAATFIAALVPVFGTVLIWGPISLYLLLSGQYGKAIVLISWGAIAIGTIDNLLYPYLVGDRLRMHTVPTFFSILGGITLFGASGLIIGPVALAVTTALLEVWWERTQDGRSAEEAVAENSQSSQSPQDVLST